MSVGSRNVRQTNDGSSLVVRKLELCPRLSAAHWSQTGLPSITKFLLFYFSQLSVPLQQAFFHRFSLNSRQTKLKIFSKLKQILNLNSKIRQFLCNFRAKIANFPIKLQNLPPKLKEFYPKLKDFFF